MKITNEENRTIILASLFATILYSITLPIPETWIKFAKTYLELGAFWLITSAAGTGAISIAKKDWSKKKFIIIVACVFLFGTLAAMAIFSGKMTVHNF